MAVLDVSVAYVNRRNRQHGFGSVFNPQFICTDQVTKICANLIYSYILCHCSLHSWFLHCHVKTELKLTQQ